jgi:hypothetical protein
MNPQDEQLAEVVRGLGFTHCPTCQVFITPATVRVGWNPHAMDDAVFPLAWLTCTQHGCGTPLKRVHAALPGGRRMQSQQEAIQGLVGIM